MRSEIHFFDKISLFFFSSKFCDMFWNNFVNVSWYFDFAFIHRSIALCGTIELDIWRAFVRIQLSFLYVKFLFIGYSEPMNYLKVCVHKNIVKKLTKNLKTSSTCSKQLEGKIKKYWKICGKNVISYSSSVHIFFVKSIQNSGWNIFFKEISRKKINFSLHDELRKKSIVTMFRISNKFALFLSIYLMSECGLI